MWRRETARRDVDEGLRNPDHGGHRAQFRKVMSYDSSGEEGCLECPVERVTWHEAAAYCNRMSELEGLTPCYECSGAKTSVTCATAEKLTLPVSRLPPSDRCGVGIRGESWGEWRAVRQDQ